MSAFPPQSPPASKSLPIYQVGLLLSLYVAQGLPVGFLTQALPAILRQNHVSLAAIGGFGLLMAPWALKFLWAPIVDRYFSAQWGQSRSWIIPTQLVTVMLLLLIALLQPTQLSSPLMLLGFFSVLFLINLMGATQDIATDALAVRLLQQQQQHWGNAIQVAGSRLGFIFGGGAVLVLLDVWSWPVAFVVLALLVLLNTIPIWRFKEPVFKELVFKESVVKAPVFKETVFKTSEFKQFVGPVSQPVQVSVIQNDLIPISPTPLNPPTQHNSVPINPALGSKLQRWSEFFNQEFAYFWHNREMRAWLLVLLSFKLGDSLSGAMVKPMMVDMGFRLADIGLMASMLGSLAALIGAIVAAWLMRRMARSTALWGFNLFQVLSLMLYAALAWQYEHGKVVLAWQVYTVNAIEHLAGAMALVAMLTLIMDYSRKQQAGSDFTFQVSVLAVVGGGVHLISGILADYWGYSFHFGFCAALALGCLWPIFRWRKLSIKYSQL